MLDRFIINAPLKSIPSSILDTPFGIVLLLSALPGFFRSFSCFLNSIRSASWRYRRHMALFSFLELMMEEPVESLNRVAIELWSRRNGKKSLSKGLDVVYEPVRQPDSSPLVFPPAARLQPSRTKIVILLRSLPKIPI